MQVQVLNSCNDHLLKFVTKLLLLVHFCGSVLERVLRSLMLACVPHTAVNRNEIVCLTWEALLYADC